MSRKVLVATEKPFSTSARDSLADILKGASYEVVTLESYKSKDELLRAIADADAAIVRSDVVDGAVFEAAQRLKLVVRAGAGFDTIDCARAREKGVDVMNTPGQNANAVAELAIGMMIYLARGKFDGKVGFELHGKWLGVHGFGAVGRAVARIAKGGFDMRVGAFDPWVDAEKVRAAGGEVAANVEELYTNSDIVSIHVPSTPQTNKSIGRRLLALLPDQAMVVNTARAEVVDEAELLELMAERKGLRYATDVPPKAHATFAEKFPDRYFCTPKKLGAQTEEANANAGTAAARQVVAYFEKGLRDFIVNAGEGGTSKAR